MKRLIFTTTILLSVLTVGVQYANKDNTKIDKRVSDQEVFAIHDQGTAPGWNEVSFSDLTQKSEGHNINFHIPINVAVAQGSRSILGIRIPAEFRLTEKDNSLYIFSKKEKLDNQVSTETIGVHFAPGVGIPSAVLMEKTKHMFHQRMNKIKVLEEKTEQCDNYTKSSFAMLLDLDGNGSKLHVMRFFSGPYDGADFQYIITLDEKMTKEKALAKIANFEKECVKVIFG
jgi:hypothetical protein